MDKDEYMLPKIVDERKDNFRIFIKDYVIRVRDMKQKKWIFTLDIDPQKWGLTEEECVDADFALGTCNGYGYDALWNFKLQSLHK